MQHRALAPKAAVLALSCLSLNACASSGQATSAGSAFSGTTVVIGVDAPLSGPLAPQGQGIANSVDLAVKVANRTHEVPGITFQVDMRDDHADPSIGAGNAQSFVQDPTVLGVVGPLNSGVAQSMQKVFGAANLTEISPANTDPSLSQGPDWAKGVKQRPYKSYFRTCTTDAVQGPYAAKYAHDVLHKSRVFLIHDPTPYGSGLVSSFQDEFSLLGGTVVGEQQLASGTHDLGDLVSRVKASHADFVYFGGEYPDAGPLTAQLQRGGVGVPLLAGDGVYDPAYIQLAGDAAEGNYATGVGAPVESMNSAKAYIANYRAAGYKAPYAAYGGYAYDSAWAIIEAVKSTVSLDGGLPGNARTQIVVAVQNGSFYGVTGPVSFDGFGDPTNQELTMYKVSGGSWVAEQSGTFG